MKTERDVPGQLNDKLALRQEVYEPLQRQLNIAESHFSAAPETWWRKSYRHLRHLQEDVKKDELREQQLYPPQMREFITDYGPALLDTLREEVRLSPPTIPSEATVFHAERTKEVMFSMSDSLMADEKSEENPLDVRKVSFDELLQNDKLRIEEHDSRRFLLHYSPTRNQWFESPLPRTEKTMLKGGSPRSTLKELAGARQDTIEAELPHNDFDAIVLKNDPEAMKDAMDMGVDIDGVEPSQDFNIQEIFYNRDLDLNGCLLGVDGLYYSSQAMEAAKTGHISVAATKRGIYGTEILWHQGERLFKNRGTMRLLKTVTEGKALSFDYLPLNEQLDLGIYWLVLARKFGTKPQKALLLDRLHHTASKINQAPSPEESSIYSVLDTVHSRYPFFNFQGEKLDDVGVARWLETKFLKQIGKKYRDKYRVPTGLEFSRQPDDNVPYRVSLEDYSPKSQTLQHIEDGWDAFLSRSQQRTQEYFNLAA